MEEQEQSEVGGGSKYGDFHRESSDDDLPIVNDKRTPTSQPATSSRLEF